MRVLFIGDRIIDEYRYVVPLGKSPKENLVPVRYEDSEEFEGGTGAAARHAESFCEVVTLRPGWTVRKARYVERPYMRKLFEVQSVEGEKLEVNPRFSDFDITVVTDFGHGAITPSLIEKMTREAQFLCVCAQTNASNIGFNLITKYPHADYMVIDEPEARLAARDRTSKIEDVIDQLAENRCEKFVVTHGSEGAVGFDSGKFYRSPAFTDRVLDTMGAGDAFFAITSLFAQTTPMSELLRIGNAAGAIKTGILGHRKPVTKEALYEFLRTH